jgi:hypothetical protein
MTIKIKLPNKVRVECPTVESAVTILTRLNLKKKFAEVIRQIEKQEDTERPFTYPNSENARSFEGAPAVGGRPAEGEGFQAYAGDVNDHDAPISAPPSSYEEEEEGDVDENDDDDNDEGPETLRRRADFDDFDAPDSEEEDVDENDDDDNDEGSDDEDELEGEVVVEEDDRKLNTRSRHAGMLIADAEVENSDLQEKVKEIFLDKSMGERTRRVFDFIQTRLVFSTKDVQNFAAEELGRKMNKKTKRKIRESLKTIERNGFIQKTAKGEWRKVS